jgi:hypothetical protein
VVVSSNRNKRGTPESDKTTFTLSLWEKDGNVLATYDNIERVEG